MRSVLLAMLVAAAVPTALQAQAAPAPAAAAKYSVETDLGTLLDNPATKAVLQKYVPAMISNPQIDMARSMSLKTLQQYSSDTLTDDVMTRIDADLAKIG